MSSTLTVQAMVDDIKNRIPIGLQDAYIIKRLNESFLWIGQQASFMWNLRRVPVAVDEVTVDFPLPNEADPGDVMSLYGADFRYEIPFIPFQQFSQQQEFSQPPQGGIFSAWTIINTGGIYMGKLAPDTELDDPVVLNLFYHASTLAVVEPEMFFPSPDEFDYLIVDLTEAEIKRRYYIAGWQDIQAKALESAKSLKDVYASDKTIIQGLADQVKRTQEAQAQRAE
jgi:hypothetical protein